MRPSRLEQTGLVQRVDRRLLPLDEFGKPCRPPRVATEWLPNACPEREQNGIDPARRIVDTLGVRRDGATALTPESGRGIRH